MRSLLVFFSSVIFGSSATLYVRPFPAGMTITGKALLNAAFGDGATVRNCVVKWYKEDISVVTWSNNRCVAYKEIYSVEDSKTHEINTFLLNRDTKAANKCSVNATLDVNQFLTCRPGWKKIVAKGSTACYTLMENNEVTAISELKPNQINACKIKYEYATAASIHSAEEEKLIIETFSEETPLMVGWYGVKIGLRLDNPTEFTGLKKWYWVDGSPRDYPLIHDEKDLTGYCGVLPKTPTTSCSYGALYWIDNRVLYSGGDFNPRQFLCKYTL